MFNTYFTNNINYFIYKLYFFSDVLLIILMLIDFNKSTGNVFINKEDLCLSFQQIHYYLKTYLTPQAMLKNV